MATELAVRLLSAYFSVCVSASTCVIPISNNANSLQNGYNRKQQIILI
jgi:hypothetical protein